MCLKTTFVASKMSFVYFVFLIFFQKNTNNLILQSSVWNNEYSLSIDLLNPLDYEIL